MYIKHPYICFDNKVSSSGVHHKGIQEYHISLHVQNINITQYTTQQIAHTATGPDPHMIATDACVHSPHDLTLRQTPELYCFTTFNILTTHYCKLWLLYVWGFNV